MAGMKFEYSLFQCVQEFRVVDLTYELTSDRLVQGQPTFVIDMGLH